MKYKVKISNISFDLEFEKITSVDKLDLKFREEVKIPLEKENPLIEEIPEDIEPPLIKDLIVTPVISEPTQEGFIDFTDTYYDTLKKGAGTLELEKGKRYRVNTIQTITLKGDINIKSIGSGKRPLLVIGKENYIPYVDKGEDDTLFHLNNGTFVSEGVDICLPPQKSYNTRYSPAFFSAKQDPKCKWTAIVKDCNTQAFGRNGGLGMGTIFGGEDENHVAFINVQHGGPYLMQVKNPYPDSVLYATLQNVSTDYLNPDDWQRRANLTTGILNSNDNTLSLTGDTPISCIYGHFFNTDVGANRSTIANIGRFTFILDTIGSVINDYKVQLRPVPKQGDTVTFKDGRAFFFGKEPQAGDSFIVDGKSFSIVRKLKTEWNEWTNEWGKGPYPKLRFSPQCWLENSFDQADGDYILSEYVSTFNLYDIDQPTYLIYKADFDFSTFPDSKFGASNIIDARPEHIAYNHDSISLWADNVHLEGYYRQTRNGAGYSLGYNMINCSGFADEFNPPVEITTTKPMPERISSLL